MTTYREGFRGYLFFGVFLLVALLVGGWARWKFDQGKIPPIIEGEEKDGLRRTALGETTVMAHSWSQWYEAPEYGLACAVIPREAELRGTTEVRYEDGTIEDIHGRVDKLDRKAVAARYYNDSVMAVRTKFFTWDKIQYNAGDVYQGERLEDVTTVKLAPNEWSDWVVRPEGTSRVIARMDSYAEAVVKCGLRLADGTVRVVPAAERWDSGLATYGIRLHNEGANPVEVYVLAWRPLEQPAQGSGQVAAATPASAPPQPEPVSPVPAPQPQSAPSSPVRETASARTSAVASAPLRINEGFVERGERMEFVASITMPPGEWSEWMVRPRGAVSLTVRTETDAKPSIACALRYDDGSEHTFHVADRSAWHHPAKAMRLRNETTRPVEAVVYAWRPLRNDIHAKAMQGIDPEGRWDVEQIASVVVGPLQWAGWVERPVGCWGLATAYSDGGVESNFAGEARLADGSTIELDRDERNRIRQEVVAARVHNPSRDHSVKITFYTWRKR